MYSEQVLKNLYLLYLKKKNIKKYFFNDSFYKKIIQKKKNDKRIKKYLKLKNIKK